MWKLYIFTLIFSSASVISDTPDESSVIGAGRVKSWDKEEKCALLQVISMPKAPAEVVRHIERAGRTGVRNQHEGRAGPQGG